MPYAQHPGLGMKDMAIACAEVGTTVGTDSSMGLYPCLDGFLRRGTDRNDQVHIIAGQHVIKDVVAMLPDR